MTLGGRAIQVLNRPFWLILNGYYVIFNSNTYQNLGTYNVFNSLTHIEVTFSPKKTNRLKWTHFEITCKVDDEHGGKISRAMSHNGFHLTAAVVWIQEPREGHSCQE